MNHRRAEPGWPPVVVASVFQTGLNLMRDLLRRGVRVVGVDSEPENEGFLSRYGKSYLCPDPDTQPEEWVRFMIELSRSLGEKPVIIPAGDLFVTALGAHADALRDFYIFSQESIAVQAALATKEQQYALAGEKGLPIPRSVYVQSRSELEAFVSIAKFPCLLKPRHHREWDALPAGNPMHRRKLVTATTSQAMLASYSHIEALRPEAMAQEIIAGEDDTKFCYLSVYGHGSQRLGHCVVREYRGYPIRFGSASVVEPVNDPEIASLCHTFLSRIGYVGICEIEMKRDVRDGTVRLIEANPRYSLTADAAGYAGVDIGWLHYLSMIGQPVEEMYTTRFDFRHIALRRDIPAIPQYLREKLLTWGDVVRPYRGPKHYFDFDPCDPRPTARTLARCTRSVAGNVLRRVGVLPKLPA